MLQWKVDLQHAAACQHVIVAALCDTEGLFHAIVLRILRVMFWPRERRVCVTSKTDNLVLAQVRHARAHTDSRLPFYCKRKGLLEISDAAIDDSLKRKNVAVLGLAACHAGFRSLLREIETAMVFDQAPHHQELTVSALGSVCQSWSAPLQS